MYDRISTCKQTHTHVHRGEWEQCELYARVRERIVQCRFDVLMHKEARGNRVGDHNHLEHKKKKRQSTEQRTMDWKLCSARLKALQTLRGVSHCGVLLSSLLLDAPSLILQIKGAVPQRHTFDMHAWDSSLTCHTRGHEDIKTHPPFSRHCHSGSLPICLTIAAPKSRSTCQADYQTCSWRMPQQYSLQKPALICKHVRCVCMRVFI